MFEQFIKMSHVIRRLKKSKFKGVLDRFADYLIRRHYSEGSIRHHRNALEHFFSWLELKKVPPTKQINRTLVDVFIKKHIPVCQCLIPAPKRLIDLRAALNILLRMQTENSGRRVCLNPISKREVLINKFNDHLVNVCGLSESTRSYHIRYVKIFLSKMFPGKFFDIASLTSIDVRKFIYNNIQTCKRRTLALFIYSIRTFFKFLQFKGIINTTLIDSLPRIIEWKSAKLPDSLNRQEVQTFLRMFNRKTKLGRRNYAIMLCMIELGLRPSEVANLKLEDIDWRKQTVNLPRGKTRQDYVLPMTRLMMDAIIDYLKFGRPKTTSRQIFVYHGVCIKQEGVLPKVISNLVYKTIKKLDWTPVSSGSNLLRRTFATNLLKKGASIKEIADLLRHRSINTTAIYTKVDFHKLRQVALPWLSGELR